MSFSKFHKLSSALICIALDKGQWHNRTRAYSKLPRMLPLVAMLKIVQLRSRTHTSWIISCLRQRFCVESGRSRLNSPPPGQNGNHFTDDSFRCIFVNEKFCILIKSSPNFVPKDPFDNNSALVEIMAWRRISDKPLSEPTLTRFSDACMRH